MPTPEPEPDAEAEERSREAANWLKQALEAGNGFWQPGQPQIVPRDEAGRPVGLGFFRW